MKQNQKYILLFVALVLLYAGVVFLLPPDPILYSRYHLTSAGIRFLNLSFVLPFLAIWGAAFYGAWRVKHYATLIGRSKDGKPLNILANGLLWLVLSAPVTASISNILMYIGRIHPAMAPSLRIVTNYVTAIAALIAFWIIGKGAFGLAKLVGKKPSEREQTFWVLLFICLSSLYCFLLITQRSPHEAHDPYFLPNWLALLTIALPYLYIWYRGLLAVYHIYYYQKKVKGTLYRQAIDYLAKGLAGAIFISILIQFLTTASIRLNRLDLTPLLIIVYCLLLLYAISYAFIAIGAQRLKKIEEV